MLTPESLELMPVEIRDDRFVVMEYVKGAPVDIVVTAQDVKFLNSHGNVMESPEVDEVYDIVVERLSGMFRDTKEIIMEQHKVADYIEAEGMEAERPEIPRDFETITLKVWLAGGEYPNVPVVFHGEPKGAPYYCQDVSIFAYAMYVDDQEQDIYQMGAICGSYGIPFAPVMGFVDGIDAAMKFSEERLDQSSIIPYQAPLLGEDGQPKMTDEGYFQNLPPVDDNTRFGHLIRSVKGRGKEHYVAHLN